MNVSHRSNRLRLLRLHKLFNVKEIPPKVQNTLLCADIIGGKKLRIKDVFLG